MEILGFLYLTDIITLKQLIFLILLPLEAGVVIYLCCKIVDKINEN